MFKNIKADLSRYCYFSGAKTPIAKFNTFMNSYGFQAMLVFRFGKWAENQPVLLRYLLLLLYYPIEFCIRHLYGIKIDRSASIGKGFYIGHFGGIVIGKCTIGEFCSICQKVKIVTDTSRYPQIGNNVWIGAHAQITVPVTIGHGATIGAGAIVKTDIDAYVLAMGNPARVIKKDFDNCGITGFEWVEQPDRVKPFADPGFVKGSVPA